MAFAGECLTLNTCEWTASPARCRNADGVFSLWVILETGDLPLKYYLNQKCCAGILRRAESRGKQLPAILKNALENQMRWMQTLERQMQSATPSKREKDFTVRVM